MENTKNKIILPKLTLKSKRVTLPPKINSPSPQSPLLPKIEKSQTLPALSKISQSPGASPKSNINEKKSIFSKKKQDLKKLNESPIRQLKHKESQDEDISKLFSQLRF